MNHISRKLIGFVNILQSLKNNFLNNSLPNSIIFYGNKGIGKTTFTYYLLNEIYSIMNNNNLSNHSNLIYNNSFSNVKIVQKKNDEKTNKLKNYITIDQIRNLESFVYFSSLNNFPKFIIIDSADDLNLNSANGLLKILEEPTNNTFFILISHQISSLLPTIRSRCIKFKFTNPTIDEFKDILVNEKNSISDLDLKLLYDLSDSSPGIALLLYSQNIIDDFGNLIKIFKENKPLSSSIDELSYKVGKYNNDQFKLYLSIIKFILVNTMKINLGISLKNVLDLNTTNYLYDLSKFINNKISLKILEYLNYHEKDIFVFNLDKKIFNLNIFSSLSKN